MTQISNPFFQDKVAIITGGGGLLCSAIAKDLARQGTKVALLGRTLDTLESVAHEISQAGGTALPLVADATDIEQLNAARIAIKDQLGDAWFLINGAGGNQAPAITTLTQYDPIELSPEKPEDVRGFFNLDPDAFENVIRVNTMGTMIPTQVFGADLARLGRGSILTFSSMTGYKAISRVGAYATAKTGIIRLTEWLATYLAPAGIRVNGIVPGFFVNDRSRKILMNPDGSLSKRGQDVLNHSGFKRFGEAEELLGSVNWLLNDEQAAFVTGQMITVDGGFLANPGV
ncbi:SDR family NAD(P)-dependent oxidoreductase [Coraliomargarita algicola]|uniref:SDR family NAD(P)-dependent oxidoreductase n=1 Tax=Coraliomargarita algicola TaxID=3092156 RepID=A0ABZ0RPH8_9BACT|nr:SDR family NAD(P)-dependent oxidoreductase [Coraliomargarita sp. J2-16]WPJ94849.1 SDR family NAD(P)-dependent oxidoreductase [Coraliomargarita sp. J2-16]